MNPAGNAVTPAGAAVPVAGHLARQPIVDRAGRLAGFELLYRGAESACEPLDTARSTARLLMDLFAAAGLDEALGTLRGFVNVEAVFVSSRLVELLPPERVVLELSEAVVPDADTVARLRDLRLQGYRLAVDRYGGDEERLAPLWRLIDYVKVDVDRLEPAALGRLARPFRAPAARHVRLVATRVEAPEQYQIALAHGFELFQGYHFARPEPVAGKRAPAEHAGLLRLLSLVITEAADELLEQELSRQPAMSVNLLRLVNGASAGLRTPVRSLREALLRLGRRPLASWLQLLLYSGTRGVAGNPLLHTAALRGKLMEGVARELRPGDAAFAEGALMVGLLSLMHVVLGEPQPAFAAKLGLAEEPRTALESRGGRLGRLLEVIERREAGLPHGVAPLDPARFAQLEMEALRWASAVAAGP